MLSSSKCEFFLIFLFPLLLLKWPFSCRGRKRCWGGQPVHSWLCCMGGLRCGWGGGFFVVLLGSSVGLGTKLLELLCGSAEMPWSLHCICTSGSDLLGACVGYHVWCLTEPWQGGDGNAALRRAGFWGSAWSELDELGIGARKSVCLL